MGRFDTTDDKFGKKLERSKTKDTMLMLIGFEPTDGAQYREHWVMLRFHRGRNTNWTGWSKLSTHNLSIFTEKYPAFEIIEDPAFSLDGPEMPFVRYQWCKHERYNDDKAICASCRATLHRSRYEHKLFKR